MEEYDVGALGQTEGGGALNLTDGVANMAFAFVVRHIAFLYRPDHADRIGRIRRGEEVVQSISVAVAVGGAVAVCDGVWRIG